MQALFINYFVIIFLIIFLVFVTCFSCYFVSLFGVRVFEHEEPKTACSKSAHNTKTHLVSHTVVRGRSANLKIHPAAADFC